MWPGISQAITEVEVSSFLVGIRVSYTRMEVGRNANRQTSVAVLFRISGQPRKIRRLQKHAERRKKPGKRNERKGVRNEHARLLYRRNMRYLLPASVSDLFLRFDLSGEFFYCTYQRVVLLYR